MSLKSRTFHVDMDAFFASVETVKDPSLQGFPVVVGHAGPRGVVASASYEARRFGIKSAMPTSKAKHLCPEIIVLPGNHSDYSAYSQKVRTILEEYSPRVEAASIDEFYLDMAGCQRLHGNFFNTASIIGRIIRQKLGLPVSIGIGSNRTLAKIASKLAKPRGVLEVLENQEEVFMSNLPVGLIPGVGPAVAGTISSMGIKTAGELASIPPPLLEKLLGVHGLELHLKARGIWRGRPATGPRPPKSIGHETTFPVDTFDPFLLKTTLFTLIEKSAFRLREKNMEAGKFILKVRYSDFSATNRTGTLQSTNLEKDIFRKAVPLLESLTRRRSRVRLIGISLSKLRPAGYQNDLFKKEDLEKRLSACLCLDRLKKRFGSNAVRWAAGIGRRRPLC